MRIANIVNGVKYWNYGNFNTEIFYLHIRNQKFKSIEISIFRDATENWIKSIVWMSKWMKVEISKFYYEFEN